MFSNSPEILQPPRNITVFENQTAIFSCEISGGFPSWAVNGKPLPELPFELRSNLDTLLINNVNNENPQIGLTIIGRVELNGTTVMCLVNGGLSDGSNLVSLSVQGK